MTLPPVSIPHIPLPFQIPEMIHPLLVHFSIALPIVIIILEIINLFTKRRTLGVLSFAFMVLLTIVLLMAYMTGVTDGQLAKELLSPEAKDALVAHKQLGIYIFYASVILMLFKLFSIVVRKTIMRVLFLVVLLVFTAAIFNEGKKGGELVYQYGVNVKSIPAIGHEKPKPTHTADAAEPAHVPEVSEPAHAQRSPSQPTHQRSPSQLIHQRLPSQFIHQRLPIQPQRATRSILRLSISLS